MYGSVSAGGVKRRYGAAGVSWVAAYLWGNEALISD